MHFIELIFSIVVEKKRRVLFFFPLSNKVFIAQNKSSRKSYGRRVSQTARWRRVRKATFDTVCHDSIISYLVSLYQMLSSAKPNWFAAEMKGWQTAIHHRFCRHVGICMRHQNVCVCVCVEPEGQWNERLTNSFRAVRSLRWLAGPARVRARTWRACTNVCVYRCVCAWTDVGVRRTQRRCKSARHLDLTVVSACGGGFLNAGEKKKKKTYCAFLWFFQRHL